MRGLATRTLGGMAGMALLAMPAQAGGTKPATLEGGAVVMVPLFINVGEKLRVDTRTDTYLERVKS